MRLITLLLQAFGPFRNKTLDFSTGSADLHVIYGPNEAGKSSALRAMTDLRFGIPLRSPDDFIHAAGDLRIAGIFLDQSGERLGLVRRKGRGATLSRLDATTEQRDPGPAVDSRHERELTGGLQRAEFEAMFGLNHARLREGGKVLLSGEGDLGSTLFEASAGTRGITALLAALEVDAKKLYSPHGRTQNAVINEARRQLDEQRQAWRQAQTKPADWQTLNRAHEAAASVLDETTKALESLRRRENELTELRTVEPLLREYDRAAAALESLAGAPDLADNAREERLAAVQALDHASRDLREAEAELERCALDLQALALEPLVLDHAEAIERLVAGVASAARHRIEVQQQGAVMTKIETDLAMAASRLAPGREPGELLQAVPSSADRVALDAHLTQVSRLRERLDGYRQRAEVLDMALHPDNRDSSVQADQTLRQRLAAAVRRGQSLGDVVRQKSDLERQLRDLETGLEQALSDMGSASDEALRQTHPILEAQIAQNKQELAALEEQLRKLRDEQQLVGRDLDSQRLRQRQLAAEGEVVTADTLRLARGKRDQGWALIRRCFIERTQTAEDLAPGFDPTRPLPEAFEASEREADRQADLLRADAKRAAGAEECAARIEQMEARRAEILGEMAMLAATRGELLASWARRLKEGGLPDLEPDSLREWQGRRYDALQLADRVAALRADRDRLVEDTQEAVAGIADALRALGHPLIEIKQSEAQALSALIERGLGWEQKAVEVEADRSAKHKVLQAQRLERGRVEALRAEAEADLQQHIAALQQWHARLFMPSGTVPEALKVRLDELDSLAQQAAMLGEARQRKALVQAILDDLIQQSKQVAGWLGEPASVEVEDFADRLRARLSAARAADQARTTLLRDRTKAQEKQRNAESERAMQEAVLARICAAAGVTTIERVPQREEEALRKREARKSLSQLCQQIAAASSHSDSELRRSLSGRDALTIESERERCREEITMREQDLTHARHNEEHARRALESIDASDRAALAREAMESAAARYRSAIRPWARLKLARALLEEALNRFRERAQAPMVSAASSYFALVTGGVYERLITDDQQDKPELCALRSGGSRIRVEEMSEGTADQLYLALRLAALEVRRAAHPQMPLVLDDALITSDDERAANILRALARFAEGGQVMIFTHHQHLLDVARAALGERGFVAHRL